MSIEVTKIENENKGIIKFKGDKLRILQLTDIHLGGSLLTKKLDQLALDAVMQVVKAANPDFIIITGDMVYPMPMFGASPNNLRTTKKLAKLMESFEIPWTVVFGNHDAESFSRYKKEELGDYYKSLKHCYFMHGAKEISGVGNYSFEVRNENDKLIYLLMFLDSHSYITWNFFSGFDVIKEDQIEWYKKTVSSYSGEQVPSLAFFHIPPKEFKEAWEKCYRGDSGVKYHFGFVQEKDNYFGYPKTLDCAFFREMVKFGSCKGMFMGHDHLNTLSLTYQGIRLTYGMSIDYYAYTGIRKKKTQRGGTIIEINKNGTFDVSMLPLVDIEKERKK